MHKGKQKICKFFVVPGSSPALLGMLDIENLGLLTINDKTIDRQLATSDNADTAECPFSSWGMGGCGEALAGHGVPVSGAKHCHWVQERLWPHHSVGSSPPSPLQSPRRGGPQT